jgi:hypothetical protein
MSLTTLEMPGNAVLALFFCEVREGFVQELAQLLAPLPLL